MKIFTAILITLLVLTSFSSEKNSNVYICVSPNAPAYHYNNNCRGLARCTHKVIEITKTEAINKYKRRLCGFED